MTTTEFTTYDAAGYERIVTQAQAKRAAMIAAAVAGFSGALVHAVGKLIAAHKRRAAAAQLLAMDDRMLRDIGLTRAEVPLVVCGLATGEAPDVFANAKATPVAGQANENSRRRAA